MQRNRRIAIRNFYGVNEHIYDDQLGFDEENSREARSNNPHTIFMYYMDIVRLQMVFYYIEDDTFYAIATMVQPIKVKKLPRFREISKYVGYQCDCDADDDGEILGMYETVQDIWDNCTINGKHLDEVLRHSYICCMN